MNVGIAACSNGLAAGERAQIETLKTRLLAFGMHAVCSPLLFAEGRAAAGTAV